MDYPTKRYYSDDELAHFGLSDEAKARIKQTLAIAPKGWESVEA